MKEKYKNQYRVKTKRLKHWNYEWSAAYFVTICTKNKVPYFGEIKAQEMELSRVGVIANVLWQEIKFHAKNVSLGSFVVMPNHLHGVLILNGNDEYLKEEQRHAFALQLPPGERRFQNQGSNSLSSIIGSYKSAVTKHCNRLGFTFVWQSSFYEHIIRNEQSFYRISNYIIDNPINWNKDRFYR